VATLLVGGTLLPAAAQPTNGGDSGREPAVGSTSLVWPGPPDKPRVRFVAAITGEHDVTGPVKLSWVDRLAGKKPARERLRLNRPYGVAADPAGRVYVADGALRSIVVIDHANKQTALWRGNGQFPLSLPMGLALDGQQRLFVSDAHRGQIVVFGPDGRPVGGFGQGALVRPGGMAIDVARNRLYVTDAKANQVVAVNTVTLELERTIGVKWSGKPKRFTDGMLAGPTNVAVDAQGAIYVVDTIGCKVQVFGPDGTFLRSLGSQGVEPGHFIRPKGIAIDSQGHVYVADSAFNNFQIFTLDGQPLMFVGAGGYQPGQFMLPAGLYIDSRDRVYVTEQRLEGGRLQIFQYLADAEIARSGQ